MAKINVNYGTFDEWATKINEKNNKLNETLLAIQKLINSLEGEYESDAAVIIRQKITGMSPKFEDYHTAVKKYALFLENTAQQYRSTETGIKSNADQFI